MEFLVDDAGLGFLFAYVANPSFRGLVDEQSPSCKLSDKTIGAAVGILLRLSEDRYQAASLTERPLNETEIRLEVRVSARPPLILAVVHLLVRDTVRMSEVMSRMRILFGMAQPWCLGVALVHEGREFGVQSEHELLSKFVTLPVKSRRDKKSVPLILTVPESIFRWPDDSKTLLLRASLLNLRGATLRCLRIKFPSVLKRILLFVGFDQ